MCVQLSVSAHHEFVKFITKEKSNKVNILKKNRGKLSNLFYSTLLLLLVTENVTVILIICSFSYVISDLKLINNISELDKASKSFTCIVMFIFELNHETSLRLPIYLYYGACF